MSNKSTVKGFFSTKSKSEQIEEMQKVIAEEAQNIKDLNLLSDIMNVILGYIEVDKFKQEKEETYYQVLK
jgi:sorting nexin-1/2